MSDIRNPVQRKAVKEWFNEGGNGTISAITGIGKNWIAIRAIRVISQFLDRGIKVLHLAEVTRRRDVFNSEIEEYLSIFPSDFMSNVTLEFGCYQGAYKLKDTKWDLVIFDEIHEMLTEKYINFAYNNSYLYSIGLTATVPQKKKILLNTFCPIVFEYSLNDGKEDNTSRNLKCFAIYTRLDNTNKNIAAGSKSNPFKITALGQYKYLTKSIRQNRYKNRFLKALSDLLCKHHNKNILARNIIDFLSEEKIPHILFGNNLGPLHKLVPTISNRNKKEHANIISDINSGKSYSIGSFKMLKQGENIKVLDAVILKDYTKENLDYIQRIGRLRKKSDIPGIVIAIITLETSELNRFNNMIKGTGHTYVYCSDFEDFKIKYEQAKIKL